MQPVHKHVVEDPIQAFPKQYNKIIEQVDQYKIKEIIEQHLQENPIDQINLSPPKFKAELRIKIEDLLKKEVDNVEDPIQAFLKQYNKIIEQVDQNKIKEIIEQHLQENPIDQINLSPPKFKAELRIKIEDLLKKKVDNWGLKIFMNKLMAFESLSSMDASHIAHKESTIKNRFFRKLDKSFEWAGSILSSLVHLTTNVFQSIIISPFAIFQDNSRQALKIQGKRMKHDVIALGLGFVGTFSPDSAKKLTIKAGMNYFNDPLQQKNGKKDDKLLHNIEKSDTLSNVDADFIFSKEDNKAWSKVDKSFNWGGMVLKSITRLTSNLLKTLIASPVAIISEDARNAVKIHGSRIGFDAISFATGLAGIFSHQTAKKIHTYMLNKHPGSQKKCAVPS